MNPSASALLALIVNPPAPRLLIQDAPPRREPLAPLPELIGWMLGPPAPLPSRPSALVEPAPPPF